MRLFCFPGAGGGAFAFGAWGEGLRDVEVHAAQLPGRQTRAGERPLASMASLIAAAHDALVPLLDRPCALLGHSLGAIVAFELARALRDDGVPPHHLFVCGARGPHLPRPTHAFGKASDADLTERLRALEGTPPEILANPKMLEVFLPAIRADLTISESYRFSPAAPLPFPITAFGGTDDAFVSRGELQEWRWHTAARFTLRMLPGGHFFIADSRTALLGEIERALTGGAA
jgi:surfactin synthase thioesterase subunit